MDSMDLGYGLRVPHYRELRERGTRASFVEALAENFLGRGGLQRRVLERVRRDARVALHGVSLSIGGVDPLNWDHVRALSDLGHELEVPWISDYLCFGSVGGHYAHDLWPLPYTEEAVEHVADRARAVQDALGRPLILENVSSYVEWCASTMPEWEFAALIPAPPAPLGILRNTTIATGFCTFAVPAHEMAATADPHDGDPRDALPDIDRCAGTIASGLGALGALKRASRRSSSRTRGGRSCRSCAGRRS